MKALLHFDASPRLRARLAAVAEPRVAVAGSNDAAGFAREVANAEVGPWVAKAKEVRLSCGDGIKPSFY